MKATFEFKDDPKELEMRRLLKSFYKAALGAIEGRFDEDDEDELEELEEFKKHVSMESTKNSIVFNFDLDILDDEDIKEYKEALMPQSWSKLI